jgi:hypothetical protein
MAIDTPPCRAYPLGAPVQVNFTVSNIGPGVSKGTVIVSFDFPLAAAYQSITVTDPTGVMSESHSHCKIYPKHGPSSFAGSSVPTANTFASFTAW